MGCVTVVVFIILCGVFEYTSVFRFLPRMEYVRHLPLHDSWVNGGFG